jgi:phage regulator Rha-like protein
MRTATQLVVPSASIERRIHSVRDRKVMLDSDLAALYGVTTGALNQAVRRNKERFPDDFMFVLTTQEVDFLLSQFVIAKTGRGGRRTPPYAFTEHGVAMLSSVLNSERAIQVNMAIIRAFIRMRELIVANKNIAARVDKLERSHKRAASVLEVLVEDIDRLAKDVRQMKALPAPRRRKIGFGV